MHLGDRLHTDNPPRWSLVVVGVAIGYLLCLAQVAAQAAR